jgi:hypothetical protein
VHLCDRLYPMCVRCTVLDYSHTSITVVTPPGLGANKFVRVTQDGQTNPVTEPGAVFSYVGGCAAACWWDGCVCGRKGEWVRGVRLPGFDCLFDCVFDCLALLFCTTRWMMSPFLTPTPSDAFLDGRYLAPVITGLSQNSSDTGPAYITNITITGSYLGSLVEVSALARASIVLTESDIIRWVTPLMGAAFSPPALSLSPPTRECDLLFRTPFASAIATSWTVLAIVAMTRVIVRCYCFPPPPVFLAG